MTIADQIRRAKRDYLTNVYDGHGVVSSFVHLSPEDARTFRQELLPHQAGEFSRIREFEGTKVIENRSIESWVEFMFSNNKPPTRYAMANVKNYPITSGE